MFQGSSGGTWVKIIAQHEYDIRAHGRGVAKIAVTVFVSPIYDFIGHTRKCHDRIIVFAELQASSQMLVQSIWSVGTNTSPRTLEQFRGKTDGFIIG